MLGDERERGMYDGYGAVMRRCLELPEADVEDWIYGSTHAIWESGDADTRSTRGAAVSRWIMSWVPGSDRARTARGHRRTPGRGIRCTEVIKWIFVVAALAHGARIGRTFGDGETRCRHRS